MLQHVGLSLGESSVTGVQVTGDGLGLVHQTGELLVGGDQGLVGGVVDLGVVLRVVGVILAVGLLAQEVDGIGEVSAPAIDVDGSQLRIADLSVQLGDVGLGVQHDQVVAQAGLDQVGEDVGGLLGGGGGTGDVVSHLDGQLNAGSGQLFDGLSLVLGAQFGVVAGEDVGLVLQADFVADQLGVVNALGVHSHEVAGVAQVLAGQGVDVVGTGQVVDGIQAVVQGQTEVLVGNGGVPVGVGSAVFVLLVVHQVDLVGVLGGTSFDQVVVELVVGIVVDGVQLGGGQLDVIQLAGSEHLVGNVSRLDHLDGDGVEQLDFVQSVVGLVLGQNLLGLVDVLGDGVGAVVPHGGVVSAEVAVNADLSDQVSGQRSQTVVGGNGGEVGQLVHADELDGVVVGAGHSDHLVELVQAQSLALFLGQGLGVLVVLTGALDHFDGHGGVGGLVLVVVQNPLQTGRPVFGHTVGHVLALVVDPGDILVQFEDPGLAAVGGGVGLGSSGHQRAVSIVGEQVVVAVGQDVQVNRGLRVVVAERFHFVRLGLVILEVLDLVGSRKRHGTEHQHQSQHESHDLLHNGEPP